MQLEQPEFLHPKKRMEREDKDNPFSQEKRIQIRDEYLTKEGREEFAKHCIRILRGVIGKVIGSDYESRNLDELVQWATSKAVFYLKYFDGRSSLTTWIYKIGLNEARDFLRRMNARKDISKSSSIDEIVGTQEDISDPRTEEDAFASTQTVQLMLECLTDREKQLLLMKEVEGYSIEELMVIFGVPNESTLRVQLFRIRKKVGEYMQKQKKFSKRSS